MLVVLTTEKKTFENQTNCVISMLIEYNTMNVLVIIFIDILDIYTF